MYVCGYWVRQRDKTKNPDQNDLKIVVLDTMSKSAVDLGLKRKLLGLELQCKKSRRRLTCPESAHSPSNF